MAIHEFRVWHETEAGNEVEVWLSVDYIEAEPQTHWHPGCHADVVFSKATTGDGKPFNDDIAEAMFEQNKDEFLELILEGELGDY